VLNSISRVHNEKLNETRSPGNQTEMLRLVCFEKGYWSSLHFQQA